MNIASSSGQGTPAIPDDRFIVLAVRFEASFVSPLPRSKRNHRHSGGFQASPDFSMASNQTARGINFIFSAFFRFHTAFSFDNSV